jgi:hypothetical protein
MKRSKFSEEQILTILRGAPGGDRFRDRFHPGQRVRGHRLTHRRVGHAKGAGPDRRAAGKLHDNDTGYAVRLHPRARDVAKTVRIRSRKVRRRGERRRNDEDSDRCAKETRERHAVIDPLS